MSNPASANSIQNDENYDSDVVEVVDFPAYFQEREGRLFHSSNTCPYPLPSDTPEIQRLNGQHVLLKRLIGANYVGPVPWVLGPDNSPRRKAALDLCCGSGLWVTEMASEFPHVLFTGIDIVPLSTRYPLPNVQFEVDDINERLRWSDNTFDLVHARSIGMATLDFPRLLAEIGRVLRPGGLFLSCEWGRYPSIHPSFRQDPATALPGATRFFETLHYALEHCRGIQYIPRLELIDQSDLFTAITTLDYHMPVGSWPPDPRAQSIGKGFKTAYKKYADSVTPLLKEGGLSEVDADDLKAELLHDLRTVPGVVSDYHIIFATRK